MTELRQLYETTTKAKLRLRAQIILLVHPGRSVADIAPVVCRSRDTVERVLKCFLQGGSAALPPRTAPGRTPTVTPAWTAALLRVIDLAPHTVEVPRAHWTPRLWATYLAAKPQVAVTAETVRFYLHAAGGVCTRPTWPLKRKAEEPPGYVGHASGWR